MGIYQTAKGTNDNLKSDVMWEETTTSIGAYAEATLAGLFAYQGWSYLNFVVDELEEPKKNLPKGIFMSLIGCTSIYLLANMASFAVAIDVADRMLPKWLGFLIPVCVALSCIGG